MEPTKSDVVPSKVLHVRGLPPYTSDQELIALCQPFGNIIKTFILQEKHQGFVQMDSIASSQRLLDRYTEVTASIRGKPIYFQYSKHEEITTNNQRTTRVGIGNDGGEGIQGHPDQDNANSILLVSVLKARIPVTLENIYQVFRPYGEVLKIVLFTKDGVFKALVQMGSVESAMNAKVLLEGKDMYQGCCHLRIGFSTLKELIVKNNSSRSRDFTRGDLQSPGMHQMGYLSNPQMTIPQFGGMGYNQDPRFEQKQFGEYPSNMGASLSSMHVSGMGSMVGDSEYSRMGYSPQPGSVLLCSNLPQDEITPDKLFILFGVYGDVMRVKILYQKRDTALIQFANPQQAHMAMAHLSHLQYFDKEISISPSRHAEINMPRTDGIIDDDSIVLTKDFSGSSIHRFKHRDSRNLKNIHPPSRVLHVSHLHDAATDQELIQLFGERAIVQFFATNRTMAYVKLESIHAAVLALIKTHNYKLKDRYIRVSFSGRDPASINPPISSDEMLESTSQ